MNPPYKQSQEAILYDPDNPTHENSNTNQLMLYDPDRPRESQENGYKKNIRFERKQKRDIIDIEKIPEGSILKVI